MHLRLVALILTATVGLLGGCDSGSGAEPPSDSAASSPTPTAPPSGTGGTEPEPALQLKRHFGTGSYCVNAGGNPEDYLWSGTWLAAGADATLTGVAPVTGGNLEIVGSWVFEDKRDDGEFGPWSEASPRVKRRLIRLPGTGLAGGSSYRVVLRLHPSGRLPGEMSGFAVDYTSGGRDDTVIDDSTLRIAAKC